MKCLVNNRIEIKATFTSLRDFSYNEKKSPIVAEEAVNAFLDAINELKEYFTSKTERVDEINVKLEKLTWYNDLDEECLMLLNDIISLSKDLRSTLIRQYVSFDIIRKKGIAKEEIKAFKDAIDDLKESYEDLESVFFFLPEMPEFTETTKRLSLVS